MFKQIKKDSPNFDNRAEQALKKGNPWIIVIHYTGTENALIAEKYYLNQVTDNDAGRISPHYMIDKNGQIIQYVDESKRAWHAGKSFWKGESDINSASIGIELVNNGNEIFPDEQINQLGILCKKIKEKYNIKDSNIIGHCDIAPERKLDPGRLFPWEKLYSLL